MSVFSTIAKLIAEKLPAIKHRKQIFKRRWISCNASDHDWLASITEVLRSLPACRGLKVPANNELERQRLSKINFFYEIRIQHRQMR